MIVHWFILATSFNLAGFWQSTLSYGAAGPVHVTLRLRGGSWQALDGRSVATATADFPLRLRFADANELFVRRRGAELIGQWIQPPLVTTGVAYAAPVRFRKTSGSQWVADAHPLPDVAHLFLAVRSEKGELHGLLRNPEFNFGGDLLIGVHGSKIQLRGRKGHILGSGHVNADGSQFSVAFQDFRGVATFRRAEVRTAVGFVARSGDGPYAYRPPLDRHDGWRTGSLRSVEINAAPIAAYIKGILRLRPADRHAPYVQSLLIARHGKLVLDEYFFGFDADRPHDVRSAGKSIATLLVGRAMADGAAILPDTRVYGLFPQYAPFAHPDPRKDQMTIADLMSMTPGWACDDNDDNSPGNEGTMQSQSAEPNWYKYALDLPMVAVPGGKGVYCSAGINLLGGIVTGATHKSLIDYFYDRFAAPMQFRYYNMNLMPPPVSAAYMGGGEYFLPRDFLKFAQIFLDDGMWNGRRVIDSRWLQAVSTKHSSIQGEIGAYGYGWHLYTYRVHKRTIRVISAGGNGGQLLFAIPDLDMAVMITAGNYGDYRTWSRLIERTIPDVIIPSVVGR